MPYHRHPSHKWRYSDSSLYDEVCEVCNITDTHPDAGELCPGVKTKEIKADYNLDDLDQNLKNQRFAVFFDRWNRWFVMDSPKWLQKVLIRVRPKWFKENLLYFTLVDEINKEINREIIEELTKAMRNEKPI